MNELKKVYSKNINYKGNKRDGLFEFNPKI